MQSRNDVVVSARKTAAPAGHGRENRRPDDACPGSALHRGSSKRRNEDQYHKSPDKSTQGLSELQSEAIQLVSSGNTAPIEYMILGWILEELDSRAGKFRKSNA